MSVRSVADLMVLLYARGYTGELNEEIRGIKRLGKLMYLLLRKGGFKEVFSQEVVFEALPFQLCPCIPLHSRSP